jgi:hypothetical protein
MKSVKTIFFLLVLSLAISCNDKDEENTTLIGDVVVVSKKSGDNTVYALAYYAYAFTNLKSVKVTEAGSSNLVDLVLSGAYMNNYFVKEPTDADFLTTKPSAGTFTFDAEFETGSTNVAQDILTSDIIDPVTIETCQYSVTNSRAEFKWTALTGADSYSIGIFDASGNTVFMSNPITNTYTNVYLDANASGWISNQPVIGETYTVRIFAFKYEDSNNFDSGNIQSTSYSQATMVWGQ